MLDLSSSFLFHQMKYLNTLQPSPVQSKPIILSTGKCSWLEEYKRLSYHTPTVCSEVLLDHTHQVLHVSFAHNGTMFATSSKDGFIIVCINILKIFETKL